MQTDGGTESANVDSVEPKDAAIFGIVIYVATAIGLFITYFFALTIADDESFVFAINELSGLADEEMFVAASVSFDAMIVLGVFLAVGIAYLYHSQGIESPVQPTAAAAAAGILVSMVLLLLLLSIFEPDAMDVDIGDELTGVIGVLIGVVITGAVASTVFDNYA